MTIHYHGTPITPSLVLARMAGAHFCVSHWEPRDVETCHRIGQSVMLDNGAFSAWRSGNAIEDWQPYYSWCDRWLDYPTTWAVIPDVIIGDEHDNDLLCRAWPFRDRGAPVWHMHESIRRLIELLLTFPRVCIGSSGDYATILTDSWQRRMDEAWREIDRWFKRTPNVHMMRGMQLVGDRWPFASVDSTNIARNHAGNNTRETPAKCAAQMRSRIDAGQCGPRFLDPGEQVELFSAEAA